jgi:hypothetical protein
MLSEKQNWQRQEDILQQKVTCLYYYHSHQKLQGHWMTQTGRQHIRVYVVDKHDKLLPGDETNHNYLVTDKLSENYECSVIAGVIGPEL